MLSSDVGSVATTVVSGLARVESAVESAVEPDVATGDWSVPLPHFDSPKPMRTAAISRNGANHKKLRRRSGSGSGSPTGPVAFGPTVPPMGTRL